MLVAELELYLSRPVAPTRRIALGHTNLPTTPRPGFGGVLLGAVTAAFGAQLDLEARAGVLALLHELERGARIPQPRLRHRLQTDRIGLTAQTHTLHTSGSGLRLELDDRGNPMAHVLGAAYAVASMPAGDRARVVGLIRRGLAWRGEPGPRLISHLTSGSPIDDWVAVGGSEPRQWALEQLGLDDHAPPAAAIQRRFRELLRAAHPDHGGSNENAADRIEALSRARRILLSDPTGGAA